MTEMQLGEILSQMYNTAPEGYKVTFIHLFAIKYAEEIISNKLSIKKILEFSTVKPSFATEISKGIKLSKYVTSTI